MERLLWRGWPSERGGRGVHVHFYGEVAPVRMDVEEGRKGWRRMQGDIDRTGDDVLLCWFCMARWCAPTPDKKFLVGVGFGLRR
jgi:hypothetical protein